MPGSNEARSAAGLAGQLETIVTRLAGVYIEHADALGLVAKHTGPDVLTYAEHHRALAERLRVTAAAVLVSGYDHPLYDGWHRTEIKVAQFRISSGLVPTGYDGHPALVGGASQCSR